MPGPESERRKYADIADKLRRRIGAGIINPGLPFPSDKDLMNEFGAARGTIRQAIGVLREEGLVYTVKGRGTFLRQKPPSRRISMDSYRVAAQVAARTTYPPSTPFPEELEQHRPDVALTETTASAELAELFGVPEGTPVLRRHLVYRVGGHPVQMMTSYYLLAMVQGTWVATPESEPSPGGAIGHLKSLDVEVKKVRPVVTSRPPTIDEAAVLRTERDVLAITRQMLDGSGRVVEVAREIVIPSEGVELEYEIDL